MMWSSFLNNPSLWGSLAPSGGYSPQQLSNEGSPSFIPPARQNQWMRPVGGMIGETIGNIWGPIGGMVGNKIGNKVGGSLGSAVGGDWGMAAYDLVAPDEITKAIEGAQPTGYPQDFLSAFFSSMRRG